MRNLRAPTQAVLVISPSLSFALLGPSCAPLRTHEDIQREQELHSRPDLAGLLVIHSQGTGQRPSERVTHVVTGGRAFE